MILVRPPLESPLVDQGKAMAPSVIWRKWFQGIQQQFNSSKTITTVVAGASPFIYHYVGSGSNQGPVQAVVSGGTVSAVAISRDNIVYYNVALSSNVSTMLAVGDYIRITYTVAPNFVLFPQ